MVVFGSKSSPARTKLFEQPLDKIFDPRAIKHFNETIAAANSRSPPPLCQSLSAPLTSATLTWAKLSQDNSASKRKRAAARMRRFTIDANNNGNASLITSITSAPIICQAAAPLCLSHQLETNSSSTPTNQASNYNPDRSEHQNEGQLNEDERCRLLLNVLPEPIRCLLNEIYLRGPGTVGIFRKSPNAKHCKELKQKLESSDFLVSAIEQYQVNVIASVFKEWLRSLPDCLLMSRLYPQWIDVAKLIEPLHLCQQNLLQQSTDYAPDTARLASTSSFEDSLHSKSPCGSECEPTSLRPGTRTTSPLTDNGQQQGRRPQQQRQQQPENTSCATGDVHGQPLSRALSCSIMASDSGHSSFSSSSGASTSSSFDSCGIVTREPRAGKHFQKATPELQQLASAQSASYLKRKCYQQRQQSQCSIDYDSERNISDLPRGTGGCLNESTGHPGKAGSHASMSDFSMRERRFECIRIVRQLLEALNETNLILLRAIICVLWHIADNSNHNKMSSNNLGVCIGQSLLNEERHQNHLQSRGKKLQSFNLSISSSSNLAAAVQTSDAMKQVSPTNFTKRHRRARSQCLLASTLSLTNLSHLSSSSSPTNPTASSTLTSSISSNYLDSSGAQETAKYVPILVAFMIDNAKELFGSDVMNLFGPERPQIQSEHENTETDAKDSNQTKEYQAASSEVLLPSLNPANTETDISPSVAGQTMDGHLDTSMDEKFPQQVPDDAMESKSIIVTQEQNHLPSSCSDLFVKMDDCQTSSTPKPAESQRSTSIKQHRRHMSTSVLVHIGSQTHPIYDHITGPSSESVFRKPSENIEANEPTSHAEVTTTSILIVNTPSKHTDQLDTEDTHSQHIRRPLSSPAHEAASRKQFSSHDVCPERQRHTTFDTGSCGSVKADCRRPDSLPASSLIVDKMASLVGDSQDLKATTMTATCPSVSLRQQQHQRPLSVTESTTSSSRASSSTSGVHSESPAFSCEQDSASSSPSSHECGTRTATTCSSSSRSGSISTPSSSTPSDCNSPMDDSDMVEDTVDGGNQAGHIRSHLEHGHHMVIGTTTLSHNEAMRHNLLDRVRRDLGSDQQRAMPETNVSGHDSRTMNKARVDSERPKSMVCLRRAPDMVVPVCRTANHQTVDSGNDQQYPSKLDTGAQHSGFPKNSPGLDGNQLQSQTWNRRILLNSESHIVNPTRMPKIPFQYTTSCYGGEAVLYYPPSAHSSQHSIRHQQNQQSLYHHRESHFGEPVQARGCNRIQSLDRYTQLHHSSSNSCQHPQQQPQRSHVMMLRDYYLSLQKQSQKQQQYREFFERQQQQQSKQQMLVNGKSQKPSVSNTTSISNHLQAIQQHQHRQSQLLMMQPPVEPRRAHNSQAVHRQHPGVTTNSNAMHGGELASEKRNGDHELREQPASAAVAYQRIQPRTARIRPNQFNGLYVKRAASPMRTHETNGNNLVVLDHRHQSATAGGGVGAKPIVPSGSCIMALSQSSLSQQSSKMSSSSSAEHSSDEEVCSSDECSTSEWMESTMV